MTRHVSSLRASVSIARLSWMRLVRGKVLWISSIIALVPVLMVLAVAPAAPTETSWYELFDVLSVLLVVVPALHLAPWLVEELDERTCTYLWSRPLARWALLLGKALVLVPFVMAVCAVTLTATFVAMFGADVGSYLDLLGASLLALSLGVVGWSAITVGIGSVVPRYATATVIVYFMFLDTALGGMPFSVRNLGLSYHIGEILTQAEKADGDPWTSVLWIAGISAVWLIVAVWRVTRAEYSSDG